LSKAISICEASGAFYGSADVRRDGTMPAGRAFEDITGAGRSPAPGACMRDIVPYDG
jgi:hypothetical protein